MPRSIKILAKGLHSRFSWYGDGSLLSSETGGWLSSVELAAAENAIKRTLRKRGFSLEMFAHPNFQLLHKTNGVRMGKGKGGKLGRLVCRVQPGQALIGVRWDPPKRGQDLKLNQALERAGERLSLRVRITNI